MRGHNTGFNPIALRKAKTLCSFGLLSPNRVNGDIEKFILEISSSTNGNVVIFLDHHPIIMQC